MARPRIIDKDRGWARIKREITKPKGPHVAVGVFGAKAAANHGGIPNIKVATAHEYGADINHPGGTAYFIGPDGRAVFVSNEAASADLPRTAPHKIRIPRRSFIRDTVDQKKRSIVVLSKNLAAQVLAGTLDRSKALASIGVFVQGLIRARMSKGIPPPLRPETIRRKGSSTPLIDTGQLRASIDFEVKSTRAK
jgi:hypothetical protein